MSLSVLHVIKKLKPKKKKKKISQKVNILFVVFSGPYSFIFLFLTFNVHTKEEVKIQCFRQRFSTKGRHQTGFDVF